MMSGEIVLASKKQDVTPDEFRHMIEVAKVLAASKFWADASDGPRALAKMMMGREYGLGFMESLQGIHFIEGKLSLSAGVIAAAIKSSHKYDYEVIESNDNRCEIAFTDEIKNREIGRLHLTMQEADKTGLSMTKDGRRKAMWNKNPSDLLFARVLTRGCRRFCPDVFSGSIYSPEEFDVEVQEAPESVVNQFTPRADVPERQPEPVVEEEIPEGEIETTAPEVSLEDEVLLIALENYEAVRKEAEDEGVLTSKGGAWPVLNKTFKVETVRNGIATIQKRLKEHYESQDQAFEDSGDAFDAEPVEEPATEDVSPKESKRHAASLKFYEACEAKGLNPTSPNMMSAISAKLQKQGHAGLEALTDATVGVLFVITNMIENSELAWQ
jgi:hypothetical protein